MAGIQFHLIDSLSPSFGYTGIIVATLGALTIPGALMARAVPGADQPGSALRQPRTLNVPVYLGDVIEAVLLLVMLATLLLDRYRFRRSSADGRRSSTLLGATLRIATPILFGALGETIIERAGILNLGIEGTMLLSAFSGFVAAQITGSLFVGLLAATG